jgi:hypothetical protein
LLHAFSTFREISVAVSTEGVGGQLQFLFELLSRQLIEGRFGMD